MGLSKELSNSEFILNHTNELIATHKPDGTYVFVNEYFLKFTGYSSEDLIGKNPYTFFHPDDQKIINEHGHSPSLDGDDNTRVEFRFLKKDGTFVWLQTITNPIIEDGEVVGLITTSRDVSADIMTKSSTQVANILFDESSDMATLGAWEVIKDPFKINWSKKVYDIHELDYSIQPELVDALDFFVGKDRLKLENHFNDLLEKGESYDIEAKFKTAKGKMKWVRTIGRASYVGNNIVKVYGVIQDVTKAVEDRMRLRELADHLTRQKLQMEQFNQIVSHNLRSPIANLGVLLNYYEDSEDQEERAQYINYLKESSRTLQELLNDLVDAVKILNDREIPQEPINIKAIVGKVCRILALEISNAKADVELDKLEWTEVKYAPIYFESILMNLISNAIKYKSEERLPVIRISALTNADGDKILQVKDNGMGINMKRNGGKIFKLHSTFARNKSGKGLGLFMTKQQIEAMGGEIEVDSELGVGTTFTINLDKYRFDESKKATN